MAIADLQQLRDDLAPDASGALDQDARDQALVQAVERYSKDRPRTLVADVEQAAGGQLLDLPDGWEPDLSELVSIEYPIGNVPPTYLANWRFYRAPGGTQVMVDRGVPAAATVRMSYTARHTVDQQDDTVPAGDREAVAAWAAALLLDQLAAHYAGSMTPTIQSDSVDHGSKSGDYARRAKALRGRYFDELGIDPKRTVPASATADWDLSASIGGPRLTRGRRWT